MKSAHSTMTRFSVTLCVFTSLTLFTSFPSAQQRPPVFRTGIDLRQLDVTVLDKQRRPVRGLTAEDFVLTEDGVPQKIESFSFVDVPDTVTTAPGPVWAHTVPIDVETNELDVARVFALVVDDVAGPGDLWARRELPKSVASFVTKLNPDDLAAVAFTGQGSRSQNFTRDKARLMRAVEWYAKQDDTMGPTCSAADAMLYIAQNLSTLKNRRKAMVYFGGRLKFDTSPRGCGPVWAEMVQVAREHNITVYAVDTMGLRPKSQAANDNYLELAHHTGGRAIININRFDEDLAEIIAENSSFYLLAYQPTNPEDDGRFRRVQVKVNRPDVEVMSTRSYWAPNAPSPGRPAPPPRPADLEALAGTLPVNQIPLRATAAAFRSAESGGAVVTVALSLRQPAFAERTRDDLDFVTWAFTPDGTDRGSNRQTVAVTVPAASPGEISRYELLSRVEIVKRYKFEVPTPTKYEVRLSVHSAATDRRGSIYVDVDVPDFRKDVVSLSGVVIGSALSATPVAPARALRDLVPVVPTTERAFSTADIVTAFLRVYQGEAVKIVAVPLRIRIVDAAGKAIVDRTETMLADQFEAERQCEYQFRVPLKGLSRGEYLLTLEASVGKTLARRDVRFQVK